MADISAAGARFIQDNPQWAGLDKTTRLALRIGDMVFLAAVLIAIVGALAHWPFFVTLAASMTLGLSGAAGRLARGLFVLFIETKVMS